eukprot:TCALIF_08564-PA protein Name:"Protein of unknown function" AED:0.45 eAED:0.45 QI:0/-1/0/1/-1/1/1/0/86
MSKLAQADPSTSDEEADPAAAPRSAKYVVPKHVPAFFDGGQNPADGEPDQAQRRARKSVLSRGLFEDLKRQHLDTPEEIHEHEDVM